MARTVTDIEARIQRLEDRQEIQDLAVRYGLFVDERDFDSLVALFAPDGRLRTHAGVIKGQGMADIGAYFRNHLPNLGPSNHFVHGHVVDFVAGEPDRATGLVSSHAEMWRHGAPMITAMRYTDRYRRVGGSWRFDERIQSYMYFVDVREYAEALGSRLRVRSTKDKPQSADWPALFT
jgi:hypothetical protein